MRWDLFCRVIDNHGDVGVCWRLAAELGRRGQQVRLWIDDAAALAWMAPQGAPGVEVLDWAQAGTARPGDVIVEAFGCDPPAAYVAAIAAATRSRGRQPAWINLEYLSAEPYVERCHALPSPVLSGPGQGLVKRFFYPGFTPRTGGLLREDALLARQAAFDRDAWLHTVGLPAAGPARQLSLFCYEPPALVDLLAALAAQAAPTRLLVTAGRASAAVQQALQQLPPLPAGLAIHFLPLLTQEDFDHLLWACDLNFVRGEDSLVRALWAGRPWVWQIYPQEDGAHRAKLAAFLDAMQAPPDLRDFHAAWNFGGPLAAPQAPTLAGWHAAAQAARARLLAQPDLAGQLIGFVMEST